MAIVSLSRNTTMSAVTSRENAANRFQQKDNWRNLKESAKNMKIWWFPKNKEKIKGTKNTKQLPFRCTEILFKQRK